MSEHQIVVVFDMTAPDREAAAQALAFVIGVDGILDELQARVLAVDPGRRSYLTSWWFPESDLKHVDRNDNAHGRLVFDADPTCSDCDELIDEWPTSKCDRPSDHSEATHRCPCGETITVADVQAAPKKHARCHLIGATS